MTEQALEDYVRADAGGYGAMHAAADTTGVHFCRFLLAPAASPFQVAFVEMVESGTQVIIMATEKRDPDQALVDRLILDNLLNRDPEPEDALLASSPILEKLIKQARREAALASREQQSDEL